ncbi:hypothetical protein SAY87_017048 [Trapa incisa]|uniref:HMG box domain-containing protein n=2 Tax=Trapa TaxID=22665 RepID=A0AAN7M4K0_TRANT|nr:hypothetical protein SAY87_017048 [Trapa incisa]KAK4791737.1 hypothetical protein SAY86_032150 [Trapa natans]
MKGGKSKAESKTDTRLKRKGAASERAGKKPSRKAKPAKDPNKPKRPPSAFFVFMEEFRIQYKEKHPNNKSVAAVGKAGGDKWKSFSDAEKAPFIAKAEKRKEEYNKKMLAYNKKSDEATKSAEEDESDKSKSEVNDEDDNEDESEEEEDDD